MKSEERRSRVLSVRLHADEIEYLRQACRLHGIRNLSELVRVALFRFAGELTNPRPSVAQGRPVQGLQRRIESLERELKRLKRAP